MPTVSITDRINIIKRKLLELEDIISDIEEELIELRYNGINVNVYAKSNTSFERLNLKNVKFEFDKS